MSLYDYRRAVGLARDPRRPVVRPRRTRKKQRVKEVSDPMELQDGEVEGRYAGFFVEIDCEGCGGTTLSENDVSNGERIVCDDCGDTMVVYGR